MKKIPYNATNKYTGLDFIKDGDYNCLSLCLDFCKNELDMPYDFNEKIAGDISWKNIVKIFKDNPKEVFKELENHFSNYYDIIPPHQMRKGDIIIIDSGDDIKTPCVFAGNNKILILIKEKAEVVLKKGDKPIPVKNGIKVINLSGLNVYQVYRIREKPRKITTKAVYKLNDETDKLELIEEESYLYDGDVAECYVALPAVIGYIIKIIISIIISYIVALLTAPDVPDDMDVGRQINTRSTKEPLKVVYGLQKVGGNDVFMETRGDYHRDLYIIQTLSEGECEGVNQKDSVDQIFIDDHLPSYFAGLMSYQFYSGSDTQTYDTTINGVNSDYTDNMRYTSYIRWYFRHDKDKYVSGKPTRLLELKGKKVDDFRDSAAVIEWSDNGILCLHDFFTNDRYGLGVDSINQIDITSWTTAANYFDTKGWSFNYSSGGNKNPWAVAQDMMQHFRANISWFDGKYFLLIADINEESSVMTIKDKHIVQDESGKALLTVNEPNRFSTPKGLRVKFLDKEKNYTEDNVLIGEESGVVKSLSLMGYTDRKTACDIATYHLERARLNRTISGTFRDDCLELSPHDLITFNSTALAIADQAMRVVSSSYAGNGLINLSLQYESVELYDDDYDADIEGTYTCSLPDPNVVIQLQNPQMTEETFYYGLRTESRLHITFTVPTEATWFKHVEVWQAIVGVGDPAPSQSDYEHQFNTTNDFQIDHVQQGEVYYIALITVSVFGVKDTFSNAPKLSRAVEGNSDAPESLTFLSAIPGNNSLTLLSDKLDDPDIEIYQFRTGTQWHGGIFLSAKRSPTEQLPGVKPGEHTFLCNTRGTNGIYGTSPQSASATILEPIGWSLSHTFTVNADYARAIPLANNITGITKANPGVVSSVAHGLLVGDNAYFQGLTEMTELNVTTKTVTAVGSYDLFSINDTSTYGTAETTGGACGWEHSIKDNVEKVTYNSEAYLKCSHTAGVLTGTFTSPAYDTGVVATDYYVYFDADMVTIDTTGNTWISRMPTPNTWDSINISTASWNEIFDVGESPKVDVTILYRELTTQAWSEMTNAEILAATIKGRYFKVKIEIEDPTPEIQAYVQNYDLKLFTKT